MKEKLTKHKVTNEEFNVALADVNNIKLLNKVAKFYANIIPVDRLNSCKLHALWRCLGYHNAGEVKYDQKFTTSLWRFMVWECRRELKTLHKDNTINVSAIETKDNYDFVAKPDNTDVKHLHECIELLDKSAQVLIKQYYFDKYTMDEIGKMHGYSKEAARQKIKRAVNQLKKMCLKSV